tara:strand:+ start:3258 stop:3428 length:171 start_codon:yes stop_codon:yes gene_type:complete
MAKDSSKKKKDSKLWKHLLKLAEHAIPLLLPLLSGGKSTGKRSFKKWPPKAGKRGK